MAMGTSQVVNARRTSKGAVFAGPGFAKRKKLSRRPRKVSISETLTGFDRSTRQRCCTKATVSDAHRVALKTLASNCEAAETYV